MFDGEEFALHEEIGPATNNVAEYRAILAALQYGRRQGYRAFTVITDSQICERQINGFWKRFKAHHLRPLAENCRAEAESLDAGVVWKPREENRAGWYNDRTERARRRRPGNVRPA